MSLGDAFGDPDDVSALLFLQLEEGVEYTEVELLHEGVHVQFNLKKYFTLLNQFCFRKLRFRYLFCTVCRIAYI